MYKYEYLLSEYPAFIELTDRTSQRQLRVATLISGLSGPQPSVAMTQHAAVADAMTTAGVLWELSLTNVTAAKGHGSPVSEQSAAKHTISGNYKQPYGSIICVPDTATSAQDMAPIDIPHVWGVNPANLATGNITYEACGVQSEVQAIAHPSMTRGQMFNLSRSTTQYTLHWTELEPDLFKGSSIGAVIVLPSAQANDHQDVLICNVGAGWGTSSISMQTGNNGNTAVMSKMIGDDLHIPNANNNISPNVKNQHNEGADLMDFSLRDKYPQQIINITQDWARYLNPMVAGLNTTVINVLLQEQVFSCSPRRSLELALAALIVNGLAQSGIGAQLQGTVRRDGVGGLDGNYWVSGKGNVFDFEESQTQNWTKFHLDSTIEGYAYNTVGLGPRVAIAFLMIYCIVAIGHVLYISLTGKGPPYTPGHQQWQ